MNYKELQQIAKEVGAVIDVLMLGRHDNTVFTTGELERFAAIIEKDERIAELETYLKSETKDKESAQESFGTIWSEWQRCEKRIAQLERQRDELLAALERCRFALEPYDDIKPRDWKSDRLNLRDAHQGTVAAIAGVKGEQ